MKIYMSVDMEGITGLPDATFVDWRKHNYERARKIMTEEANYVIQATFDYGAEEVLVNDSHSKMNNLLIDRIHTDALLITGEVKPFSMMQGLNDTYSGAFFCRLSCKSWTVWSDVTFHDTCCQEFLY